MHTQATCVITDEETGHSFHAPVIDAYALSLGKQIIEGMNEAIAHSDVVLSAWDKLHHRIQEMYRTQALFKIYNNPDKRRLHNHEEVIEAQAKLIFYGES